MKAEISIYLDTSVISAYLDDRKPDRQELTKQFWEKIKRYKVYISEIVLEEIKQTTDTAKRDSLLELIKEFGIVPNAEESKNLARVYMEEELFSKRYVDDAFHLAIATVNNVNFLVSWNFSHLVNVKTRQEANLINVREGYKPIEIIPPPEL